MITVMARTTGFTTIATVRATTRRLAATRAFLVWLLHRCFSIWPPPGIKFDASGMSAGCSIAVATTCLCCVCLHLQVFRFVFRFTLHCVVSLHYDGSCGWRVWWFFLFCLSRSHISLRFSCLQNTYWNSCTWSPDRQRLSINYQHWTKEADCLLNCFMAVNLRNSIIPHLHKSYWIIGSQ